jgi:hypothetical protein
LSLITSGATSIASSGSTASAAAADIAALLAAVATGSASRLYLITTSTVGKQLTSLSAGGAARTFPDATYRGGELAGIEILISDGAPASTITLIDASGIGFAVENVRIDTSAQASVQLNDAPDSPPTASTNLLSLWQSNLVAVLIERFFAARAVRPNSVAQITGANYSSDSP